MSVTDSLSAKETQLDPSGSVSSPSDAFLTKLVEITKEGLSYAFNEIGKADQTPGDVREDLDQESEKYEDDGPLPCTFYTGVWGQWKRLPIDANESPSLTGVITKNKRKYAYIMQDNGDDNLFTIPSQCVNGTIPRKGTRVQA